MRGNIMNTIIKQLLHFCTIHFYLEVLGSGAWCCAGGLAGREEGGTEAGGGLGGTEVGCETVGDAAAVVVATGTEVAAVMGTWTTRGWVCVFPAFPCSRSSNLRRLLSAGWYLARASVESTMDALDSSGRICCCIWADTGMAAESRGWSWVGCATRYDWDAAIRRDCCFSSANTSSVCRLRLVMFLIALAAEVTAAVNLCCSGSGETAGRSCSMPAGSATFWVRAC